jgi:hypothetical protein
MFESRNRNIHSGHYERFFPVYYRNKGTRNEHNKKRQLLHIFLQYYSRNFKTRNEHNER